MTLPWESYGPADWLRARPLFHAVKSARYQAVRRAYERRAAAVGDEAAVRNSLAGRNVLITIAFEDAGMVARQAMLVSRFVPHDIHLIVDNSASVAGAAAVQAAAAAQGLAYLRLPPNPWTAKEPSRSHGIAMNWVWHRILRGSGVKAFGFLDHDLFPLARDDPFELLARHPFFGDIRRAGTRWFLWAGYCFFRMDDVRGLPLDFGQDWFIGLDTGGGNWRTLYRHLDPGLMPQRPVVRMAALEGAPADRAYFERRGEWLHAVGFGGDAELKIAKRRALDAWLDMALEEKTSG